MPRATKFIDYDVETAFSQQVTHLDEAHIRRLIDAGHPVYATKEILSGNQLEIEIYPEFTKKQKDLIPGYALKKRAAQQNLDFKNSRKRCERKVNANFGDNDIWATFTYSAENRPSSFEEANRDASNYIRRLNYIRKKQGLPNIAYIRVVEEGRNGVFHHHMILRGDMSMDVVEATWLKGRRNNTRHLATDEDALTGLATYLTKEGKLPGKKRWSCSHGLKEPEINKSHSVFMAKDVAKMVRGQDQIEALMMRRYGKEYDFSRAEIKYNDYNGFFYVAARLHRKTDKNSCSQLV